MSLPIRITPEMVMLDLFEIKHRELIAAHLKRLSPTDRYLRFCSTLSDDAIDAYVQKLDFIEDACVVIYDESQTENFLERPVIGFLHASKLPGDNQEIEFGISVDETKRNLGLASQLFSHGLTYAEGKGYYVIYMNCLYENKAMRHIVKKAGFDVDADFDEVTARMKIDPEHPIMNSLLEITNNTFAIFDLAYRAQIHRYKQVFNSKFFSIRF